MVAIVTMCLRKQRTATFEFLLGACFFIYLPLIPCLIILCNWRRRRMAKKRLLRKVARKKQRLLRVSQQVSLATVIDQRHSIIRRRKLLW